MLKGKLWATTLIACTVLVAPAAHAQPERAQSGKIIVKTQDDLPRYSYDLGTKPSELLLADDATFAAFTARVGADIDDMLAAYRIDDKATMRELLDLRGKIEMLNGNDAALMDTIEKERALEEKPDSRLLNGLREEAMVMAAQSAGASQGEAYEAAYAKHLEAAVAKLPWEIVGTGLKSFKTSALIAGADRYLGSAQSELDPIFEKNGAISMDAASSLIYLRYSRERWVPVADETAAVISKEIAARDVRKPDIWEAREVTLTGDDVLTPVVVAIWDSGVDLDLFPGKVYVDPNPSESTDPSGIAYDLENYPAHGELMPLTDEQAARYPGMQEDLKGLSDLQLSIESPEADAVARRISTLKPEAVQDYWETLGLFSNYAHGTHVAGIAAHGNPAIRLAYARITFEWRTMPLKPTEELSKRWAEAAHAYVDWFKRNNVRVVNMSWGGSPSDAEPALEKHGIGKDAEERREIARRLFMIERDGLFEAMESAPGILFITAAGNSDSSNSFDEDIPSSFVLPNLLTVGAVDQAGDETGFTSYGDNVKAHANGYQVPSYVPGGRKIRFSGTSMAAPNVANLAAKLLALDPALTPEEVIGIIVETATPTEDGRRNNIHPKAAVAKLKNSG